MPKLHLVGVTADLKGLVFSHRARDKTGDLVVEVTDDLVQAIDEIRRRDARPRHPALTSPALPTRHDGSSNGGSSLGLREIQHRLRTGETVAEVAARAGVTADWVERFAAPIRAEQSRIVQLAWRLTASKARLGPSSAPLGLSVVTNVLDRGVTLSREEMEDAWRAFQVVDGVWTIRFGYTSRGRSQMAEWELTEDPPVVSSSNRLASDLGYLEGEPAALAVALLAAAPAKAGRVRPAGPPAMRAEKPPGMTLPVVEVVPDREEPSSPARPRSQVAGEASPPDATPATATPATATPATATPATATPATATPAAAIPVADVQVSHPLEEDPPPDPGVPADDPTSTVAESPATRALPVVRASPVVKAAAARRSARVAGRRVSEGSTGKRAKVADHHPETPTAPEPPARKGRRGGRGGGNPVRSDRADRRDGQDGAQRSDLRSRRPVRAAPLPPAKRLQRLPEGWLRAHAEPHAPAPAKREARNGAGESKDRSAGAAAAGSGAARSLASRGVTSRRSEPDVADRVPESGRRARRVDGASPTRGARRSSRSVEAALGTWTPPVQGARKARRR